MPIVGKRSRMNYWQNKVFHEMVFFLIKTSESTKTSLKSFSTSKCERKDPNLFKIIQENSDIPQVYFLMQEQSCFI